MTDGLENVQEFFLNAGAPGMPSQRPLFEAPGAVAGRLPDYASTQATPPTAKPSVAVSAASPALDLGTIAKLRTPSEIQRLTLTSDGVAVDSETGEVLGSVDAGLRLSAVPDRQSARVERYRLLDALRRAFRGAPLPPLAIRGKRAPVAWRFADCHRTMVSAHVSLHQDSATRHVHYGALQTCANPWLCPVCSARISQHRAGELRQGVTAALAQSLTVSMLTLTVPHSLRDSISDLVPRLSDALQRFWRGETMTRIRKAHGIVGQVRSFEIKYGAHGWHPHFHVLVFSRRPLKPIRDDLSARWISSAVAAGLSAPHPEIGLTVQDGSAAGEYISKMGSDGEVLTASGSVVRWDVSDEMTKGVFKERGGLTPFQLIAAYDAARREGRLADASIARRLLIEFAHAVRGLAPIRWSRGLRDLLGLSAELTDQEVMEAQDRAASLLGLLVRAEWVMLLRSGHRATFLALAEGDFLAALKFLFDLMMSTGRYWYSFDEYQEAFFKRQKSDEQKT